METETYKNAKMILERFDPDSKKNIVSSFFVFFLCCINCLIAFGLYIYFFILKHVLVHSSVLYEGA